MKSAKFVFVVLVLLLKCFADVVTVFVQKLFMVVDDNKAE